MKWTLLLCCFLVAQVSAGQLVNAQLKVNLNLSEVSLEKVFEELKVQTGNVFVFNTTEINKHSKVSVVSKNESLVDLLNRLLPAMNLGYKMMENYVVVFKLEPKAQQVEEVKITGTVKDNQGNPLPGATIMLKGTTLGVVTDVDGNFTLSVPKQEGIVLQFTFVGMKTIEVKFAGQKAINVILEEDESELDEVVVTGYQNVKEKSMAGSFSRIKAEDLLQTGTTTIESMLQGKIPGMVVMNTSGLTGTRQKVRVRGTSTLMGSAEPVWVVDGIIQEDNLPFDSQELAAIGDDNLDMMKTFIGGAISWLNPNDIEDITVLKDASATAIYGVKAANGVIVITTKKGERGRMSVNYSGRFAVSQKMNYNRQHVMNSKERVALSQEGFERGAQIPEETIGYAGAAYAFIQKKITREEFIAQVKELETNNTDWFDILYRTPFSQQHSLSFSGGNDKATYRASFGYTDTKNTAIGNDLQSYSASLYNTFNFWNNKLIVNTSISGNQTRTRAFANGVDPFNYAINTSRVIDAYNEDGSYYYYQQGNFNYNILKELANSGNENTTKKLNVNLNARWRFTDDLTLNLTLGGSTSSNFAETWFTERSNKITQIRGYEYGTKTVEDEEYQRSKLPFGGMLSTTETRNFNYTARAQVDYYKIFNNVHAVNVSAGVEVRSSKYDGISQTAYGYMPDRGKSFAEVPKTYYGLDLSLGFIYDDYPNPYALAIPTITDYVTNTMSYYAAASYMYDDRYAINFSVRADGSNTFGSTQKFNPIWAAGLRWNVTDESWLEDNEYVNHLSLTATFGYQGNVAENISTELIAKYGSANSTTGEFIMNWSSLPNKDLKWEKTQSIDLGLNFALFNNKVNGNFDWYWKKTNDVIVSADVPLAMGTASVFANDGSVENYGWDFSLSFVPVRTKNFTWNVGFTYSQNHNSVNSDIEKEKDWHNAVTGTMNKKGYPVGSFWAFDYTGLNAENGAPEFNFHNAGTNIAAEDCTEYMIHVGTLEPKTTLGVNMMFRWKRFSFPLNLYISHGNKAFLNNPYENGYSMPSEYRNVSDELNNRWRKPGDEKFTNIPSIPVGDNAFMLYPFAEQETEGIFGGTYWSKQGIYPLDAWAHSTARIVDAWYIRFSDLSFSYDLPEKWIKKFAKNVSLSFTMSNPLQIHSSDFKGRDPEVSMGNQPRSRDYSFGINVSF